MSITPTQHTLHREHLARQSRLDHKPHPPHINRSIYPPIQNYWMVCAHEIFSAVDDGREIYIPPRGPTVRSIQESACRHFGITREDLLSRRRGGNLIAARHIAIYLARTLTDKSYPEIGRLFNRDHTVAMHAYRQIDRKLNEFHGDIDAIRAAIS